ncbi:MAG TPA: glycosyl hydrolase, partial [Candidatus Binatia bacterium]|nr:glycosyl hydrolase [Candidatus Binatia bacterium]
GHPSVKLAASIAHTYGKTIVGAESFTASPEHGRWQNYPYLLKALGDLMFCQGLNRYIFHRYAMQPWTNRWPGMTMGQWGFHFERTETWWTEGKPWIDYITHCEFLLQQGRAVADAAYFTGQSAPVEMREGNPPLPDGYDYDAINADVLMHDATVKNGRITLSSGASYAVLILPPDDINMTPPMMKCLSKLVNAGATIVGPRPQHSPSLEDYPTCDNTVNELAAELWGKCDGQTMQENNCGKGHIVWGKSLADVFSEQKLKPDFEFHSASGTSRLAYAHRVAGDADIYFVSNQRRQFDSVDCTFRLNGKLPELWHPDTGAIEPAPVWNAQDGRTTVRLDFDPAGSVFVIFRHPADKANHIVTASSDFLTPTNILPTLKIQHAVYTAIDGTGGEMDVTKMLSESARGGWLEITASNGELGGDPAPNHHKELRVDYTLDGKPGHVTVREGETLSLPAIASIGPAPEWKINLAKDGSPVITAWSNGRVNLRRTDGTVLHAEATKVPKPQTVTGEWNLRFPPNWGAPPSVTLDKLISWSDDTNAGVRYFSGRATYEKEIEIAGSRLTAGRELWLDLGAVKNFA